MAKHILFIIVSLFLSSCLKEDGPSRALSKFVSYRFSENQSFDELTKMVAGQYLDYIEQIQKRDDEQGALEAKKFLNISKLKELKKRSFKVVSQNCENQKCFLTYVLKFSQGEGKKQSSWVEVKSMAELVKHKNKWLITNINDIKTHISSPLI